MDKHLSVLKQALNKANQSGVFTLNESAMVSMALAEVTRHITGAEDNKASKNKPPDTSEK